MKNAGSGWRNTKDQESMQQLVQLETARSEHSRGKRQIQNKIDVRKGLWACETKQPPQTLVFTKTAGHKTWEKKNSTVSSPFFSFSFSIFFLHNAPHKINSLLVSARKRDHLKRDHTGYLVNTKKVLCGKYCFSRTCMWTELSGNMRPWGVSFPNAGAYLPAPVIKKQ